MIGRALIIRPLINEKSMALIKQNLYTFEVDKDASKQLIGRAVKNKFNVDVLEIKTINVKSKRKMQRTRKGFFRTPSMKKAIVAVKKGQKIAIFESAQAESFDKTQDKQVEVRTAEGEIRQLPDVKEKKSLLGRTKVRIEKESSRKSQESREELEKKTDTKRPTKRSQKESKKGK